MRWEQTGHQNLPQSRKDSKAIYRNHQPIWVLREALNLKLRISVEAHGGEWGHGVQDATLDVINRGYWWRDRKQGIEEFTQAGTHCIMSLKEEGIPRPMSTVINREEQKELVHTDFLHMEPAEENDLKYVPLIKDDNSCYSWMFPRASSQSEGATIAISKCIACFGFMDWLVTDQDSHLSSTLMKNLTGEIHIRHYCKTVYCPWANGTLECLCKELLRTAKVVLSKGCCLQCNGWR